MKRHGDLWRHIVLQSNLHEAYRKARKGKGWHTHVIEFKKDVEGNLLKLRELLAAGEFNTSEYKSKTNIRAETKGDLYPTLLPRPYCATRTITGS